MPNEYAVGRGSFRQQITPSPGVLPTEHSSQRTLSATLLTPSEYQPCLIQIYYLPFFASSTKTKSP